VSDIIIISGSPTEVSRSEQVLKYLGNLLEEKRQSIRHFSVKDVPAQDLFSGNYNSPRVLQIVAAIEEAKGVIIGSPVYKGAYSGVLKAFIDLLPQDILKHKPVLPLMTGGSSSHLLALEYALKPVLATLKAHNLKGIYLLDEEIDKNHSIPIIREDILQRTRKQIDYFNHLVNHSTLALSETYS